MSGTIVIPFGEIPSTLERPGVYVEINADYSTIGLLPLPARYLVMAQAITGSPGARGQVIATTRESDGALYGGAGSQADTMLRAAYAGRDATGLAVPIDLVLVADATGATKAAGSYTISGAWSVGWTAALMINGQRVAVGVGASDTAATAAGNLAVAIFNTTGLPIAMEMLIEGSSATQNFQARNAGLCGNLIAIGNSSLPGDQPPPGVTITPTAMSGGATNPDVSAAIEAITGLWYTDVVAPWEDSTNVGELITEAAARYGAMQHRDMMLWLPVTGTLGQQMSAIAAMNSQFATVFRSRYPQSQPCDCTAALMGLVASNSINDPNRQSRGQVVPGVVGPTEQLTDAETEQLIENGGTIYHVLRNGAIVLDRVVTTRLTNALGEPDPVWHDIMATKTFSRVRYDWRTYSDGIYSSGKLAEDGSIAAEYDPSVCTPSRRRGSWAARSTLYEQLGWLENTAANAKAAVFQINGADKNRMDGQITVQRLGSAMVFAEQLLAS